MFTFSSQSLAVGAITDENALSQGFTLETCDMIELRLDALGSGENVLNFLKSHQASVPLLITARDPKEGGVNNQSLSDRKRLLETCLPYASLIDVELANLTAYEDLIAQAKESDVALVLSSHDFAGFDHIATMERVAEAQSAGAQVAKAAVMLTDPVDLTLFESLVADMAAPFSLMGMGPYGPVSRLLAAQHGSLLNYGFLGDKPTAPGQWPARLLKEIIAATPPISVAQ